MVTCVIEATELVIICFIVNIDIIIVGVVAKLSMNFFFMWLDSSLTGDGGWLINVVLVIRVSRTFLHILLFDSVNDVLIKMYLNKPMIVLVMSCFVIPYLNV